MKKKTKKIILFCAFTTLSTLCFGATLNSMTKMQVENAFLNKTLISIPTDNLNRKTINNTFSMFMDRKGHVLGKMSLRPFNEPQIDHGIYTIKNNGNVYITWQHWDFKKKLCAQFFETKNAYIAVDCTGIFHTVYMKASMQSGDHLK